LLPVARSSVLTAAVELAALKQSSPKNAANTERLKRALIGCNTNHPAGPSIVGAYRMTKDLKPSSMQA